MKAQCVNAVIQAVGRPLNRQELTDIRGRIEHHMTMLARQDVAQWRTLTRDQQIASAAESAAGEIVAEAMRKKANIARQAVATARSKNQWQGYLTEGRTGAAAAVRLFDRADQYVRGVRQQYFGGILPVLDYMTKASRVLGWKHDQGMMRNLVYEVFGKNSGDADAKAAAKSWLDTIESMRTRFNNAGGDIGKLDYGYLPQPHDARKAFKAGRDGWIDFIMPKLDRSRYITPEGQYFTDTQIREFLGKAWETISTGGLNKLEPGKMSGPGKMANRHGDARQIHFKDAESYLEYMTLFGKGNPVTAMQSHISGLARDIALVEAFGPNPNQTARLIIDEAKINDGGIKLVGPVTASQVYETLNGNANHPVNVKLAEIAQGARNFTVATKLGGTFLSSVTDAGTLFMSAKYHRLPIWNLLRDLPATFGSKDYQEYANRVSLMADSLISDMNRWADGHGGAGWTSKAADTTMRLSLLTGLTDGLKRAHSVNLMGLLGKLTRADWSALETPDRLRLERAGIDQATWNIWKAAAPENWRGSQMLTPESIQAVAGLSPAAKDQATARLLGYILNETDTAITSPDLMARTVGNLGSQKGTVIGEIWRSLWLFKTFSVSIMSRQIGRVKDINATQGSGQALAYAASLMTSLTVLGGLSLQAKDLAAGKDPRDVTTSKFWGAAFMQGGGLGIFGDLLYTGLKGSSRGGQDAYLSLFGPVIGTTVDIGKVTLGNIGQASAGDDTNLAGELLRIGKGNLPIINLWYTRSALDHMLFNDLLEQANPGYLRRMRERTRKDWNQEYWWRPEEGMPGRAPDFGAATGK